MEDRREWWVQAKARCFLLKSTSWILNSWTGMKTYDSSIRSQSKQSWLSAQKTTTRVRHMPSAMLSSRKQPVHTAFLAVLRDGVRPWSLVQSPASQGPAGDTTKKQEEKLSPKLQRSFIKIHERWCLKTRIPYSCSQVPLRAGHSTTLLESESSLQLFKIVSL